MGFIEKKQTDFGLLFCVWRGVGERDVGAPSPTVLRQEALRGFVGTVPIGLEGEWTVAEQPTPHQSAELTASPQGEAGEGREE